MVYVNSIQPVVQKVRCLYYYLTKFLIPFQKYYLIIMLVETTSVETLVNNLKQIGRRSSHDIKQQCSSFHVHPRPFFIHFNCASNRSKYGRWWYRCGPAKNVFEMSSASDMSARFTISRIDLFGSWALCVCPLPVALQNVSMRSASMPHPGFLWWNKLRPGFAQFAKKHWITKTS